MLLGVCQGQRTKREKMGRKMKRGKKEMQCTWLVVALCQGQRKNKKENVRGKLYVAKNKCTWLVVAEYQGQKKKIPKMEVGPRYNC